MTTEFETCSVCDGPLTPNREARCTFCMKPFHLNLTQGATDAECGELWLNDQNLGLEFGCQTCINTPAEPPQGLDDVLDLAEAAASAGVEESVLRRAAEGGFVPHRRTSSGVLLFRRGDLTVLNGR